MTQYFLTMPHDSAEEPTMASMQEFDPAELAAVMVAVDAFNTELKDSGAWLFRPRRRRPSTPPRARPVCSTSRSSRA